MKEHGKNYTSVFFKKHRTGYKWLHDNLGSNYRMTEMQAAIGRVQLRLLDKMVKKRNFLANLYLNGLKDYYQKYEIIKIPDFKYDTCTHAYYRLNLFLNKDKVNQEKLIKKIKKNNINCGVGSCPEIYR